MRAERILQPKPCTKGDDMGFKEGNFPPVDPAVFLNSPLQTRMRTLAQHWGEYGFGTARNINTIARLVAMAGAM